MIRSGTRLHACLCCITFACWGKCMKEHIKSSGHKLWVDLEYGHVYCAICQDYVYDTELMTIRSDQLLLIELIININYQ